MRLGVAGLAFAAIPGSAIAESLKEAIAQAYASNPSLKAQQAEARAAEEVTEQARARFGPSVTGQAGYGYTRYRLDPDSIGGSQDGFGTQYSLSINQPLFTSGRLTANFRAAEAGERIGRESTRAARLDLLRAVVTAYTNVLRDQQLVAIAEENVGILSGQLDQTQARYDARYATATDLTQTQNRLLFADAQLEIARSNLLGSRNAYRNIVGAYPGDLEPVPPLPSLPPTLEDAQDIALIDNPDARIAEYNQQVSRANLAAARAERGPNVSLDGSYTRSPVTVTSNSQDQVTQQAVISVTMPIFTSGRLTAQVREASERAEADVYRFEQARRDVRETVASLWDQLAGLRRALPIYRRSVLAAEQAVVGVRQQLSAGQATSLDVLDTTRDLLNSRTAEAQAEAQLYSAHAALLVALGGLDVGDFADPSLAYDLLNYRPTWFAGLPTEPFIHPIDTILYDDHVDVGSVQMEADKETGHDMPVEPPLTLGQPSAPALPASAIIPAPVEAPLADTGE